MTLSNLPQIKLKNWRIFTEKKQSKNNMITAFFYLFTILLGFLLGYFFDKKYREQKEKEEYLRNLDYPTDLIHKILGRDR